jgi:hypothetical protein
VHLTFYVGGGVGVFERLPHDGLANFMVVSRRRLIVNARNE